MKIQISKIHENPNNPRHIFNRAEDDSLALSMQKQGQLAPCVVKQITPDNYLLISGERRLRAAIKNGWKELECDISDKSEGDDAIELMDYNNGKQLSWLEEYEGIAYARLKNPGLSQQELADRLGKSQTRVSNALKTYPLLSQAAKEAIYGSLRSGNVDNYSQAIISGTWNLSERAFLAICEIATGKASDLDLIERAVKVAIQYKMNEKQAKKLVEWVKAGNTPETFGEGKKQAENVGGDGQNAELWQKLDDSGYLKSKRQSKGAVHIIVPDEIRALVAGYAAAAAIKRLELRQRPGQPCGGNEFEDKLPSIYDIAIGKADEDAKKQQEDVALRQEVEGTGKFGGLDGRKVGGLANAGSGVLNSGNSKFQMPNDFGGIMQYLINFASAGTPRTISGKILKAVMMWIFGRLEGWKVRSSAKAENPSDNAGDSDSTGVPSLPKHKARNTVLIAVAVAAVFVLGFGLMKIVPFMRPNNAQSITTQKQANNIVPVADTNAGESEAITSGTNDTYIKSSERTQAIKYYKGNEYSNAFLWFGKALEKYGPRAEIYFYMGYCEDSLGNHKEAQEFFEDYLKIYPNDEKIKAKIEELKSTVPPSDGLEIPTPPSQ